MTTRLSDDSSSGSGGDGDHPVWHALARVTRMLMANPALHTVDQVPDTFKEVYILSGYRSPRSSPRQCLSSIFKATNETFNFWTHFLPAVYFWWQTASLWPSLAARGPPAYPMLIYMASLCTFPILSAVAHIFNTMSIRSRHLCFFLDYAGLGLYVLGSAVAYRAYSFPAWLSAGPYAAAYLYVAAAFGVVSFIIACQTRFLEKGMLRRLGRMVAFSVPYFFVSVPLAARLLLCEPAAAECSWSVLVHVKWHFVFAFLSAVLYSTHVPERFLPGTFDIVGHSHQLFHLCSAVGSNEQLLAILADLEASHEQLVHPPSPHFEVILTLVVIVANAFVFLFFVRKLNQAIPPTASSSSSSIAGDKSSRTQSLLNYNNNDGDARNQRKKGVVRQRKDRSISSTPAQPNSTLG